MKKTLALILMGISVVNLFAGNPDRRGEAGAYELNMNGWANSSGLWSMNSANVMGIESERINPAGLAFTNKTEIGAAYSIWLAGSDVGVAHAGIVQKIKDNALALSIQALNLGSIEKTTTAFPEGGIGNYTPTFVNIGVSYARKFSNSISGGVTIRLIDEGIGDLNAFGVCVDGGLQYVTGPKNNIHFGVSLRNVGTPMQFKGDALINTLTVDYAGSPYNLTVANKADYYELPSQLNIGGAYDIWMGNKIETQPKVFKQNFRLTWVANFTANAFGYDYYGVGAEFSWKEIFMVRAAWRFEEGQFNPEDRLDVYTGPAAGVTMQFPFNKEKGNNGTKIAIDYSYRASSPFTGTHSLGLRFNL